MVVDNGAAATDKPVWRIEMLGGLRAIPIYSRDAANGLLGSVEAVERFRTHYVVLLLARLALFPQRAHAREELADLLWPETPSERGRANLTQSLVYLRQALGEPRTGGLVRTDHKTVRMAAERLQTDVAEWESNARLALAAIADPGQAALLAAARKGYTGDLLPGYYEDWVCDERSRLAALYDEVSVRAQSVSAAVAPPPASPKSLAGFEATSVPEVGIHNAPVYLTRFFGRDWESARACALLCQDPPVRLLTLLGMGGIGKTRLALRVGESVLKGIAKRGDFTPCFEWAAFVALAESQTVSQMEGALLQALGGKEAGPEGLGGVIAFLNGKATRRGGRILVILDNLEQLGESAAVVVGRLLVEVPALTILATSRQPVGIPGEAELPLGALRRDVSGADDALADDLQLFVDRARLVRPDFALSPENERDVARLRDLLEGVPLALELAAAWARVLTPQMILGRLGNRFDLLALRGVSMAGGAPKRHRSLHAAIAWSYDLLGPALQAFFAKLSVFRGGWTAEAAEVVTGLGDASEPLLLLAERSLILVEDVGGEGMPLTRYRMLESLREFADEQLSGDERRPLLIRHARYYDELSREADMSSARRGARRLLRGERDNCRSAIVSALKPGDPADGSGTDDCREIGIRLVGQTHWLWTMKELDYLLGLAASVLPFLTDDLRRLYEGDNLLALGTTALNSGDYPAADRILRESAAVCLANGDEAGVFRSTGRLGNLAYRTGDADGALAAWRECLIQARRLADGRLEAAMLINLAIASPDLGERRRCSEEAVTIDRVHRPQSDSLAVSLNTLANAARDQSDFETARVCLDEALSIATQYGSSGTIAIIQTSLVEFFLETGENLDLGHELLVGAQRVFEEIEHLAVVGEVFALHFRLAVARRRPEDALTFARKFVDIQRQNRWDEARIGETQVEMSEQLRRAGFEDHADRLGASDKPEMVAAVSRESALVGENG